jgi:outer membrane receptor for ferrienterochelin and colicins
VVIGGIGYTWERLEMDLQARWQSSYQDYRSLGNGFTLQPYTVDNYLTMNGRIGYNITDHLTVALAAQQFNTSRLYQTSAPPVERRVIVSLTARY